MPRITIHIRAEMRRADPHEELAITRRFIASRGAQGDLTRYYCARATAGAGEAVVWVIFEGDPIVHDALFINPPAQDILQARNYAMGRRDEGVFDAVLYANQAGRPHIRTELRQQAEREETAWRHQWHRWLAPYEAMDLLEYIATEGDINDLPALNLKAPRA